MRHSSVKQTEKYADFSIERLIADFPSLEPRIQARQQRDYQAFDGIANKGLFLA